MVVHPGNFGGGGDFCVLYFQYLVPYFLILIKAHPKPGALICFHMY